jgi:hypothetical protein
MQDLQLKTMKNKVNEVIVKNDNIEVIVNDWSDLEGCSFMVLEKETTNVKFAGCMRWEEVDALLVALTAARSA